MSSSTKKPKADPRLASLERELQLLKKKREYGLNHEFIRRMKEEKQIPSGAAKKRITAMIHNYKFYPRNQDNMGFALNPFMTSDGIY